MFGSQANFHIWYLEGPTWYTVYLLPLPSPAYSVMQWWTQCIRKENAGEAWAWSGKTSSDGVQLWDEKGAGEAVICLILGRNVCKRESCCFIPVTLVSMVSRNVQCYGIYMYISPSKIKTLPRSACPRPLEVFFTTRLRRYFLPSFLPQPVRGTGRYL